MGLKRTCYLSELSPQNKDETNKGTGAFSIQINSSGPLLFLFAFLVTAFLIITGEFGAGTLVGLLFVPAIYTYLLLCNNKTFVIVPAALSIAVGFAIPANMALYFINLALPIAMTIALYYSTIKNYNKTKTVLRMMIAGGIWLAALSIGLIYLNYHTISREVILNIINGFFSQYKKAAMSVGTPADFKKITGVNYEKAIDTIIHSMKLLLPSILIVSISILSYLSALFYGGLAKATGSRSLLANREWNLTITKLSASLFAAMYVLSIVTDYSDNAVFFIVVNNLLEILTPALFIIGMKDVFRLLSMRLSRSYSILITVVILLVSFVFLGALATKLIAIIGFWAVVYNREGKKTDPE